MLDLAREYARAEGVEALLDLRHGDLREPPVSERVAHGARCSVLIVR